jgi:hypothetical protein
MTADSSLPGMIKDLGILGVVIAALVGIAKKYLDRRIAVRFDEQEERLKNSLATDLERAKHQLQLEQTRLSFVYEHQRESLSAVIKAMYEGVKAVASRFDDADEEFRPIDDQVVESFQRVRASESLYTGFDGDYALKIFEQLLRDCTSDPLDHEPPESDVIRQSYGRLRFVADQFQEFARVRLGIAEGLPLLSVFRIGTVRLLNRVHLNDSHFPTKGIFEWKDSVSPQEMAQICADHHSKLEEELARFETALRASKGASFLYTYQDEARTYGSLLRQSKS